MITVPKRGSPACLIGTSNFELPSQKLLRYLFTFLKQLLATVNGVFVEVVMLSLFILSTERNTASRNGGLKT
jgi:hypothetical protein